MVLSTLALGARRILSHTHTHQTLRLLKNELKEWSRRSYCSKTVAKNLRLFGLGVSVSCVPLLRLADCKKLDSTLSKRVDHVHDERTSCEEPSLSLWDIWGLLKPYLGWFLAAVVCSILTALVNIQMPIHLGKLIDVLVQMIRDQARGIDGNLEAIQPFAIKLVFCYAAQAVLTFMYISFLTVLGERMAADLRVKLFQRLLLLDMDFFDSQKTGELASRLNVNVQEFKSSFKLCIAQGLKTIAQIAGCMVTLFKLSPQMTAVTLVILPVVIGFGTMCGALLRVLSRKAQAQAAVASAVSDEAFSNIRTVKAFAMEEQECRLYAREVGKACTMQEILGMGIGVFQGGTNFFLNGVILSVIYSGSDHIRNGHMTPGDLMSFLVTAQTIQRSLSQLSVVFGHALKGWTAGARVFEFAKLPICHPLDEGICIPYHTLWGEVKFQDVDFHYASRAGQKVFNKLNLTIPAGQVVALCGPSGGGKSTITALLERFYDPVSGSVTLDGKDLRGLNLEWLRGQVIGLISQEPILFATSIEENIRYGRPSASDDEVRQAAQMANADSFVQSFPSGYRTVVGERGVQLSGGQKQRIAIARALLKNPPILILDEATSALDSDSERLVQEALERAMKGRTVLVIAHRLSTIQRANLICVIKDKQVAEQGSHDELMKKQGVYYNLVQSQYKI